MKTTRRRSLSAHVNKLLHYTRFVVHHLGNNKLVPFTGIFCQEDAARLRFPMPTPKFDQIQISLFSPYDPCNTFADAFGKGNFYDDTWHFYNGISLKRARKWDGEKYIYMPWSTVRFTPSHAILAELLLILNLFPRYKNWDTAFRIKSAEIAFDIHLGKIDYDNVKSILQTLVSVSFPINNYARINICEGDFYTTSDGDINGTTTYYFSGFDKHKKAERLPNSHATWKGKMYTKFYDDAWHIRCEVTLQGEALKKTYSFSCLYCIAVFKIFITSQAV